MAEKGESSDEEPTIAEDVVVTKYKMAGDMANSKSMLSINVISHELGGGVDYFQGHVVIKAQLTRWIILLVQ